MAEPGNGGEIIIKGGSVEVEYDGNTYVEVPGEPRKHKADNKKITRIVVTDERNGVVYDSEDHPGGLKWKVTATCK